jgi:hypothetical protein
MMKYPQKRLQDSSSDVNTQNVANAFLQNDKIYALNLII